VVGPASDPEPFWCENWKLIGTEASPSDSVPECRSDPGFATDVEVTFFEAPNATHSGYCVYCDPFEGQDGSDGKTFLGRDCPPRGFCISSASGAFLDAVAP
jgi:hypothetical protein